MERKAKGFYFHGRAAASLREATKCKTSIYSKKDFAKEKRQGKVLFRVVDINLVSLWKLQSAHPKDSMFVHREDGL